MPPSTIEQTFTTMHAAWEREGGGEPFYYFVRFGEPPVSADLQHPGLDEGEIRVPLTHLEALQDAGLIQMREGKPNSGRIRVTQSGAERQRALDSLRDFLSG